MSRYGSNFREPPWVFGSPKEVMEWVEGSGHSGKKEKKRVDEEKSLKNLHIKFDFNVEKSEVKPRDLISRLFGRKLVEEDFELLSVTKLVLRGLAKAKFSNTGRVVIDGKTVYDHPEEKKDTRRTVDVINEYADDFSNARSAEITAFWSDGKKSTAVVRIMKIHAVKEHSVDIQIKGEIKKEVYHTFLNYLQDKLGLKEEKDFVSRQ